jgi:hypothetical protein
VTSFVPLFHIWLGPSQSIYAMALAISLFVTILVIYSGFEGVEVNQIKLARTFGASKAQIPTKVILPGSIPTMIAALKVNAGLWRHRLDREIRHASAMACRRRHPTSRSGRHAFLCQLRFAPIKITRPTEKRSRYERATCDIKKSARTNGR